MQGTSLTALWRVASALRDELGPDATLGACLSLLAVARAEEAGRLIEPTELVPLVKLTSSSISRHILWLGEVRRIRKPGLGFVAQTISTIDRRKRPLALTPKGRRAVNRVTNKLAQECGHISARRGD